MQTWLNTIHQDHQPLKTTTISRLHHRPGILLIALAYLGFVSLGLPDGLLGVGWPSIRQTFGLSLDTLGALLTTFTLGYLVSSFSSGRVLARMGVGTLLTLSGFATAMSLLGYALTPVWWLMVALGALAGLGAGAIDAGLNTYVATHHSARTLNWLHASFGLGAAIGPLVMTGVLQSSHPWQWGYGIVGVAQLGLATCFALTRTSWETPGATHEASDLASERAASAHSTLRLPVVWLGIVIFFVYTGIEVTAGQWTFSLFTVARSIPDAIAGTWISIYWGSLMVGRLLFGVVVGFAFVSILLRFSLAGIIVGAVLVWLNITALLSFMGLALMGLALAPIFPSLISTTPQRLGTAHAANGVGFQIAAAALGGALLPSMVGVLANKMGLEVVGPALVIAAMLLLVLHELLLKRTRFHKE
jgi:fucose permease